MISSESGYSFSDNEEGIHQTKPFSKRFLLLNFWNIDGPIPFPLPQFGASFTEFGDCRSMDLRRLASLKNDSSEQSFLDLNFIEMDFERALERGKNSREYEGGFFQEMQSVEWDQSELLEPMNLSEDEDEENSTSMSNYNDSSWGEYRIEIDEAASVIGTETDGTNDEISNRNEERAQDAKTGYLFIGYRSSESPAAAFNPFLAEWRNWCAVRDLCDTLPSQCTFRRVTFFKRCNNNIPQNLRKNNSPYKFVLLIELENALVQTNSILNCINNAQSLCLNRAFIGLYRDIEFEIDLDVLQCLVSASKSIHCEGHHLVVRFVDKNELNEPRRNFGRALRPFSVYRRYSSNRQLQQSSFYSFASSAGRNSLNMTNNIGAYNYNCTNTNNHSGVNLAFVSATDDSQYDLEMEEVVELIDQDLNLEDNNNLILENLNAETVKMDINEDENWAGDRKSSTIFREQQQNGRKSSWRLIRNFFGRSQQTNLLLRGEEIEMENSQNNNNQNKNNTEISLENVNRNKRNNENNNIPASGSLRGTLGKFWRRISLKHRN